MTVYFAQNSTVNINSSNMWNTAANGSGSYLTWPPASGDVLMANGKTNITINVDTTVAEIRNDSANGATNGGGFVVSTGGLTLTANAFGPTSGSSSSTITFSANTPNTFYFVGNGTSGSGTGNVINVSGTGIFTMTGNPTGTSAAYCVIAGGGGNVTITGTPLNNGVSVTIGSLVVNGNPTATSVAGRGVYFSAPSTCTINGSCYGGSVTNSYGLELSSNNYTVTVTNSVYGGTGISSYGVYNNGTGQLTINGDSYAGTGSLAAGVYGTGSSNVTILKGKSYDNGNGNSACMGYLRREISASSIIYARDENFNEVAFIPISYAVSNGSPAPIDVRYGTSYALGALTGTAHIPAASSVVKGVPVDATVGTADLLTAADVRSALGLAAANLDTQLADLPTASENATAVWSANTRTLTESTGGGATAEDVWTYATRSLTETPDVPTVEEIAAEVRAELTPELSRVANCATVESTGDQLAGLL